MDYHYLLNYIMSFMFSIILIIGARGYGKTFAVRRFCIKRFIRKGYKFIWLRDTESACDELRENRGEKFFTKVIRLKFEGHSGYIEGNTVYIDGKFAGYIMALSTYYNRKGNEYDEDIMTIVFDEFIPEEIQRYNGNRAKQFINTMETIGRTRKDFRLIMTANALDRGNDILEFLGFNIKGFGTYKTYATIDGKKVPKAICHYVENSPEFEKAKNESLVGIMLQGTRLDDNMTRNQFDDDKGLMFDKRKPCDIIGIYHNDNDDAVRIYRAKDHTCYYACKDFNKDSYGYMRYVLDARQVKTGRILADKNRRQMLTDIHVNKRLLFESGYIKNIYLSMINKK